MSVAPIQVGATNKTLQGVAYVVSGGLVTGVKTDIEVADIQTLYVRRDQTTSITISSDGTGMTNKSNQNDAHADGAVWNAGGGKLVVDVPDTAFAVFAPDVELYGTWTDGSDSGIIRGTPVAMTNGYTWATFGATILNRIGAFTGTGINTILGFFKAIMFSDVSIPSDAGDTFSSSLEDLAGASAPSTSAIATAVWSNSTRTLSAGAEETYEDRTTSSKIVYYIGELIEKTVTAQEDLSSKTLEICFQVIGSNTDIIVIPDGDITVGGAGNKEVTFTNTAAITASVQKLRFSVRDTTSKKVYIQGDAEIRNAPLAD